MQFLMYPFVVGVFILLIILLSSGNTTESFASTKSTNNSENTMAGAAEETSEKLQPWLERWSEKKIGFHLKDVNPIIEKYASKFAPTSNTREENSEVSATCPSKINSNRAFVPLCGKTVDMAYLTLLFEEVVGVEGIRIALEEFAQEHPDLKIVIPDTTKTESSSVSGDRFERFQGSGITLLRGDYFDLDSTKTGGTFGFIFDRASMVAIEPNLRQDYVDVLGDLLAPGGNILLLVLERIGTEEAMKRGPPYSIPETAVRQLFENKDWVDSITILEQSDQLERQPEDRERYQDLDKLLETAYVIHKKE